MKKKNIVVFMDENECCRILTNPMNLDKFKYLDNAAVNPPNYEELLAQGVKPEQWIVIGGSLMVGDKSTDISTMSVYDCVADIGYLKKCDKDLKTSIMKIKQDIKYIVVIYGLLFLMLTVYVYSGSEL